MKLDNASAASAAVAITAAAAGYGAWRFVDLNAWDPAFPGLLTALSLMAGAVLVRLARNAPITSPSTFDEPDLIKFFDALEKLSIRLLWIFGQSLLAIILVICAVVVSHLKSAGAILKNYLDPTISGLLAALLIWLIWRLLLMARGDIGFLRLQRLIIYNSLRRDRAKESEKLVRQPVNLKSVGDYGRQL